MRNGGGGRWEQTIENGQLRKESKSVTLITLRLRAITHI